MNQLFVGCGEWYPQQIHQEPQDDYGLLSRPGCKQAWGNRLGDLLELQEAEVFSINVLLGD